VLCVGLVYLYLFHDLKSYEIVAAGLLSGAVVLGAALVVGMVVRPERTSAWVQRVAWGLVARVQRSRLKPLLRGLGQISPEQIEGFAGTLQETIALMRGGRLKLALPVCHALMVEITSLATLYATFLAFRCPVSFGVLVAGYSMGTLFMIMSITPAGVGVVEGVMVLTLTSLGVSPEAGTVVTLVNRGVTFWLPFVAGFFAFRKVRLFGGDDAAAE
jgi:uncharacterized protein (TIRG00374 family)